MQDQTKRVAPLGLDALCLLAFGAVHLIANRNLIPPWGRIFGVTKTSLDQLHWLLLPIPAKKLDALLPDPVRWLLIAIVVGLIAAYLVVDLLARHRQEGSRVLTVLRWVLLAGVAWYGLVHPLLGRIHLRKHIDRARFAHDGGVIQTELAMDYLMAGKNPYRESYRKTIMAKNGFSHPRNWHWMKYKQNPALEHCPYLPFSLVAGLPLKWVIGKSYDQRLLYLLCAALIGAALLSLRMRGDHRRALLIAVLLNPMLSKELIVGYNDILMLALVACALALLHRRHVRSASAFLGLACATKPFAWLLVPLFAAQIWSQLSLEPSATRLRRFAEQLAPLVVVALAVVLPFFLWDPSAFWSDIIAYNAGSASDPLARYPIRGFYGHGFGTVVLYFGWVERVQDSFPFIVFQLLATLPILFIGVRRLIARPALDQMVASYVVALVCFFFFARFFHTNYLTVCTVLTTLALGMSCVQPVDSGQEPVAVTALPQ